MTPELYQRLKPVYDAALDAPAEKRAEFAAEACGDDRELRAELEALLRANDERTATLGVPFIRFDEFFAEPSRVFADGEVILGRFEIVRHLGSGGMGEVYEAIDHQLGRIAIKTIRSSVVANSQLLSRFKKEVQLARRVSSRHVCRIHELFIPEGPSAGPQIAFLTMEFLEGTTLTDKVRNDGPLPWREARQLALEICAGLQCIHEEEIIHRDLKGRNIMLASRKGTTCAVLMDFGIAYEVSHHTGNTSTALTRDGAIPGTPGYIAPEQFEHKEATPATDVYALGIVLFECVTGQHPFSEEPPAKGSRARATNPALISSMARRVPRRFQEVVRKCLEYDPKRRFQSAKEVERALRDTSLISWIQQRPVAMASAVICLMLVFLSVPLIPAVGERIRGILFSSPEKHIAILPFEVVGDAPGTRALGDGLMDSLAGKLANLGTTNKTLFVVPPSEIRSRKVSDPASAMHEFGATIVVKGQFERNGETTQLKLTLIDPKKMREIGFADIENQTGDLAALQDEAVTRLARLTNISTGGESSKTNGESSNRAAYEDYLLAQGYMQRFDKAGNIDLAIKALQRAVATDPHFALGFARLGQVYILVYRNQPEQQWLDLAAGYGKQAAELDNRIPLTYVVLGSVHELTGNQDLAIQEFQRALDLDPRNVVALTGMADSYSNAGRNPEAEASYMRAAALRPDNWSGYNNLGNFYERTGKPQQALAQFQKAFELTPDNSALYVNLGNDLLDKGHPELLPEAEKAFKKSIALNPTYQAYAGLGMLFQMQHRYSEAVAACRQASQFKEGEGNYEVWNNLTEAYEWVGDDEGAAYARNTAVGLLRQAVKLNPQDANAQATLAALLAKNGVRKEALDRIGISLALSPNSGYVLSEAADTYELAGERSRAIQCLKKALKNRLPMDEIYSDPDLRDVIPAAGLPKDEQR
jgi:serine/threonine-protein kinase